MVYTRKREKGVPMSTTPKFELNIVKQIVQNFLAGNENSIWFSAPPRSTNYVIAIFLCTEEEARTKITQGILSLKESDFSQRVVQWEADIADVYGLENYLGHNWYVKFLITYDDDEQILEEISFHPLEKKLTLANGKILTVTYTPEVNL
jgi:hypothetical protein